MWRQVPHARGGSAGVRTSLLGRRRDKNELSSILHPTREVLTVLALPVRPRRTSRRRVGVTLGTGPARRHRRGLAGSTRASGRREDQDTKVTHFFFADRFRRLFGTGVRSSKCRDTVGVKCSDVIGASAESQPALPLLCAKGPFATLLGASFPKVRSQPVMGAHAAQARCKAHNTSFDGVDRSTGISSSIVVASVVCDARSPRKTTPAFCASRAAAQKPGSW